MAMPIGDGYGSIGPCGENIAVTTNAQQTYQPITRAILVSAAGTLQFQLAWATASTTITVVAGQWLPLRVKYTWAAPAGTQALW